MRSVATKIPFVFCLLTLYLGSVPLFAYAKTPLVSQVSMQIEDGLKSGAGIGKSALSGVKRFRRTDSKGVSE